jgi:hypothetical protein
VRILLFILVFNLHQSLFSQRLAIGVKGGVRLTEDFELSGASQSKRYLAGAAVEIKLPLRFAIEADALYSRAGFQVLSSSPFGSSIETQRANVWEIPLLAKFRPFRHVFAEAGYAPRIMTGSGRFESTSIDFLTGNVTRSSGAAKRDYDVSHGLITGGGIEFHLGPLRLSPEVRYTRWNNRPVDGFGSHGYFVRSTQNRADVLLGIWWK